MSDEEFYEFCALNEDHRIERTAAGDILIMAPAGGETGYRNMDLSAQLHRWSKSDGRGVAFDSSTGFRLPNGATRSPDAAWVLRSRLTGLTREQRRRFLPVCPDFVLELTSPTDRLSKVQEKMQEWMANGATLGWILDADNRQAHVYRPGSVEILDGPQRLAGEGLVEGFVLELAGIWDPVW
ncbi:MAG: Uma2 family endonuclease [Acidobacteria bacterium]|nr:Uma2 family endonuclease [Acidobacteriota bacterium]